MAYSDHYTIDAYGCMIADDSRSAPLIAALRGAIGPDTVVLDIGTGPGFFALLACQLGAARVYAVEPDDAIEIGRMSAERMGVGDRITWLRGMSTDIELPEKADLLFADLHGNLPFWRGNLKALIDARRRHLAPSGVLIPRRDTLYAVPVEADDEYQRVRRPWETCEEGVDLVTGRSFVVNSYWRARAEPVSAERYLANPSAWAQLDYRHVESPNASGRCSFLIERAGTLHGYYVWFDCEAAEGLVCSNAPTLPERVYGRCFFPLERPIEVERGDSIEASFSANLIADEYVLRWSTEATGARFEPSLRFAQNTFAGTPRIRQDLERTRPEFRPELGDEGRALLMVLEAMARGESVGEIARQLSAAFPQRFGDHAQALRYVADRSLRYAKR